MNEQSTADPRTGLDKIFAALRGIDVRRRSDDKWIGGVASGLADRLGVDPVIVRAALVLLAVLGGVGVGLYLVAWVLLPNDKGEIVAERALVRGEVGSIILLVIAVFAVFGGSWWGQDSGWGFPWGLVLTGLLIWWLVQRSHNRADADLRVAAVQSHNPQSGVSPQQGMTLPTGVSAQAGVSPQAGVSRQPSGVAPQSAGRYAAVPSAPAAPPVLPRTPRRRSGGPLMTLLAIGLGLVTYGSLMWLGGEYSWIGDHRAIAMAGSLAAMGVLLVGLGLAGWRAGFLAFLTVVLAIATWSVAVVPSGIHLGGPVGDQTWRPTTLTSDTSYRLGAGDGVLDLSDLPTDGLSEANVPAYVGLGELTVVVPEGLIVRVVGHVGLGNITAPGDPGDGQGGTDVTRTISVGDGPTEVVVDAGVGVGQLTVVKE